MENTILDHFLERFKVRLGWQFFRWVGSPVLVLERFHRFPQDPAGSSTGIPCARAADSLFCCVSVRALACHRTSTSLLASRRCGGDVEHFRKRFPQVGKIVGERGGTTTRSDTNRPETIQNGLVHCRSSQHSPKDAPFHVSIDRELLKLKQIPLQ